MAGQRSEMRLQATRRALSLVTEAMDLLDAHGLAPDAAANLAMAQHRLRQLIADKP